MENENVLGGTKGRVCKPRERAPAAFCQLSGKHQHTSTVSGPCHRLLDIAGYSPWRQRPKPTNYGSILRNRVCFPNVLTDTNQPWPQHSFKGPEYQPRPGTGHTTTIRNSQATSTNIQDSGFMLIKTHLGIFTILGQS